MPNASRKRHDYTPHSLFRSPERLADRYKQEHDDADRDVIEVSLRITDCYLTQYETMARFFQAIGRTESRYGILRALFFAPNDYLTPKEIQHAVRVAPGNVTYLLDELERDGLLVRSPHPQDRRATCIRLTEAGLEQAGTRIAGMVQLLNEIGKEFTSAEKRVLINLLGRFQARADALFREENR
jgi:DNA-binding MarR family transcriptional regulator